MAQIAVHEAIRLGATFADARYEINQHEDLLVRNAALRQATVRTERGLGLRVLVNGAWGFAAASQPTRHDAVVIARRAIELGRAAAVVQEKPIELAPELPHSAVFRTPIERDPLAVAVEDKLELLFEIDRRLRVASPLIKLAIGRFSAHRTRKLYVNSEGSEIDQDLVYTGVGFQAGASDGHDFQVRSYPNSYGAQYLGRGWELVESLPLVDKAEEIAQDAVEQLKADPCPSDVRTLILGGSQLALQIHESTGHPAELDRALGYERNFAGTSFLTPDRLGNFEYGSPIVHLYADARAVGGLGTYGYDDEGVEAQKTDLVSEGRFLGYLSSRESARRVGLVRSSGAMRADSWASPPLIRMTNICLAPGAAGTLEDLVADTKSGILMDSNRSWSIDDQRLNFQFGCEVGWEIKDGKRVRRVKNPIYASTTPAFWRNCDAICGEPAWSMYGFATCGKGQPLQMVTVGHGTAPARFTNVDLGARALERSSDASSNTTVPDRPNLLEHPDAARLAGLAKVSAVKAAGKKTDRSTTNDRDRGKKKSKRDSEGRTSKRR
jgi:TldD protein